MSDSEALRSEIARPDRGRRRAHAPEADTAPYLVDQRRLYRGSALAVALPRRCRDRSRASSAGAIEQRIGLVPQGGNTGYCGGATPDESGRQLLLSLRRLESHPRASTRPISPSPPKPAACSRSVQQAADAAERFFPLSLGSEGSCQIGGNLATNAGGLERRALRHGARPGCSGIEAVLPDGQRVAMASNRCARTTPATI